jgi:hypothetical protein
MGRFDLHRGGVSRHPRQDDGRETASRARFQYPAAAKPLGKYRRQPLVNV